jgi:BNR/Asp-box repeat protein
VDRRLLALLIIVALFVTVAIPVTMGADPVTVPNQAGQTKTVTWQGTVLPGSNTDSECTSDDPSASIKEYTFAVPSGTYNNVAVGATASISYDGPVDLIITVIFPDGKNDSGDDGFVDTDESVSFANPVAGKYTFLVCPFAAAAPQAYTGTLTLKATKILPPPPAPCPRPSSSLSFSKPIYVDTTRAGGEPSVVAHPNGTLLYAAHAGTTHFYSLEADDPDSEAFYEQYRGQVHAYYSTDHGKTWRFVDRSLPPENLPNSGFSDPDFAIDYGGNVYLTEINLVNVAMSKSTDAGRHYGLQNFFSQDITDRQWTAAGPTNIVFQVGNASEGGTVPTEPVGNDGHTIYRTTDGGRTFSQGFADPGGLGDIIWDRSHSTLYEAHYAGGKLQIAAFRQALDARVEIALTPSIYTIANGVSMLSHWPAIDVDSKGNLYVAWDESGTGALAAGVYYSYSRDGGRTWARAIRVDGDNHTDIWPWIAVGAPGRVAVGWFGNDHKLPNNDAEAASSSDPWNVYIAQTLNGLGCSSSPRSGFRVSRATPQPFHVGTVCMGGTTCQAQLIDRRLGDYFTIDIDTTGRLVAAYSDTRQGGAVSLPAFFRQSGGALFTN